MTPTMRSLAFNRGKRLSEGTLVEAHVEGRVLGLRLLKIDALVALVPASPAAFEAVGLVQSGRSMSAVRNGSVVPGSALADAVRTLDEAAVLLADDRRNGSK